MSFSFSPGDVASSSGLVVKCVCNFEQLIEVWEGCVSRKRCVQVGRSCELIWTDVRMKEGMELIVSAELVLFFFLVVFEVFFILGVSQSEETHNPDERLLH